MTYMRGECSYRRTEYTEEQENQLRWSACSQRPFRTALFSGSPDLVWLCLPILLYHPMQIVAGSVLVPRLR
jgi:hypothetical protein